MTHYDGYTHAEVIGGRTQGEDRLPRLGRCSVCGLPYEASLDGVVLPCPARRDERHRKEG